jgi:hypothetical protein
MSTPKVHWNARFVASWFRSASAAARAYRGVPWSESAARLAASSRDIAGVPGAGGGAINERLFGIVWSVKYRDSGAHDCPSFREKGALPFVHPEQQIAREAATRIARSALIGIVRGINDQDRGLL